MTSAVVEKIEAIAQRVAESEGIEVVEVELKGSGGARMLRISIDKPEGVTHADCENVSQQVGTILDVEDLLPGRYTLEVSSPGVERKLLKLKDYSRFQGRKVKILLREPLENSRRWEGLLTGVEAGGRIGLEVAPGRVLHLAFDDIEKANLKFEWGSRAH